MGRPKGTPEGLLKRLVHREDGCWIWPGKVNHSGYGRANVEGRGVTVHRAIYEHVKGPLAKGLVLHHQCRNRACGNPDHLEPCTIMENVLKDCPDLAGKAQRMKTHCPYGHPYSGENVRHTKSGRQCVTCINKRRREKRAQARHGQTSRS